jgi:hypothetical protein
MRRFAFGLQSEHRPLIALCDPDRAMSKAAARSWGIGCVVAIALASLGVLSVSAAAGAVSIAPAGASRDVGLSEAAHARGAEARSLAVLSSPRTDRGIVQSVSAGALVLKVLDGSTLVARVDAKTRVFVNGKRAAILAVERGFVAVVTYEPGKRGEKAKAAREVQAFGTPRPSSTSAGADSGIVQSVSASGLVLKTLDRRTRLVVRIDKKTRAFVNGKPASILAVEPGFVAVVRRLLGQPAREVWAFAPRHERGARLDLGVVRSLTPGAIVLGKAGGGSVAIELDARTRVFVNGKAGSIHEVEPGFVAVVRRLLGQPAREVWAFGRLVP